MFVTKSMQKFVLLVTKSAHIQGTLTSAGFLNNSGRLKGKKPAVRYFYAAEHHR
jgi:hypothetical protein